MIALALLACVTRVPEPEPVTLAGAVTLVKDSTRRSASLVVHSLLPKPSVLPAERNGVPWDGCETLVPTTAGTDLVLRPASARAWCGGVELDLVTEVDGSWRHVFPIVPEPGLSCEVELDGQRMVLPDLPPPPDLAVGALRLSWSPADAEEIRYVVPRSGGRSTVCRLQDDGDAPTPKGARYQLSFATRVRLGLPPVDGGRVAISVINGVWIDPVR